MNTTMSLTRALESTAWIRHVIVPIGIGAITWTSLLGLIATCCYCAKRNRQRRPPVPDLTAFDISVVDENYVVFNKNSTSNINTASTFEKNAKFQPLEVEGESNDYSNISAANHMSEMSSFPKERHGIFTIVREYPAWFRCPSTGDLRSINISNSNDGTDEWKTKSDFANSSRSLSDFDGDNSIDGHSIV